jgi:hypothetical protein
MDALNELFVALKGFVAQAKRNFLLFLIIYRRRRRRIIDAHLSWCFGKVLCVV